MRKIPSLLIPLSLGIILVSACTTRQLRPIATIDPDPFLRAVQERRSALERGVSGILEIDFRKGKERFRGKLYVAACPDGRFRLEVPGPWGSTTLVMASDGNEVLAYYPAEGKAYRSLAEGRSINPFLPFPLPLEPDLLPALFMGVSPEGKEATQAEARLMSSGGRSLRTRWGDTDLWFVYMFTKAQGAVLTGVTASRGDIHLEVKTEHNAPHLPRRFSLSFPDGSLEGRWMQSALSGGSPPPPLATAIPDSVTIVDLEEAP